MGLADELAVALSADVYAAIEETGDDRLHERVAKSIGALSPTLEETFMTAMRLRLADRRGRDYFTAELARLRAAMPPPATDPG